MKQNKLVAFVMVLVPLLWLLILLGFHFYPFYVRNSRPYPPVNFIEIANKTIGKNNYVEKYYLDRGFLTSYTVSVDNNYDIDIFKNLLTKNNWVNMGVNDRQQTIFCLNPNNSIAIWADDEGKWIGFEYKMEGTSDCTALK